MKNIVVTAIVVLGLVACDSNKNENGRTEGEALHSEPSGPTGGGGTAPESEYTKANAYIDEIESALIDSGMPSDEAVEAVAPARANYLGLYLMEAPPTMISEYAPYVLQKILPAFSELESANKERAIRACLHTSARHFKKAKREGAGIDSVSLYSDSIKTVIKAQIFKSTSEMTGVSGIALEVVEEADFASDVDSFMALASQIVSVVYLGLKDNKAMDEKLGAAEVASEILNVIVKIKFIDDSEKVKNISSKVITVAYRSAAKTGIVAAAAGDLNDFTENLTDALSESADQLVSDLDFFTSADVIDAVGDWSDSAVAVYEEIKDDLEITDESTNTFYNNFSQSVSESLDEKIDAIDDAALDSISSDLDANYIDSLTEAEKEEAQDSIDTYDAGLSELEKCNQEAGEDAVKLAACTNLENDITTGIYTVDPNVYEILNDYIYMPEVVQACVDQPDQVIAANTADVEMGFAYEACIEAKVAPPTTPLTCNFDEYPLYSFDFTVVDGLTNGEWICFMSANVYPWFDMSVEFKVTSSIELNSCSQQGGVPARTSMLSNTLETYCSKDSRIDVGAGAIDCSDTRIGGNDTYPVFNVEENGAGTWACQSVNILFF